MRSTSEHDDDDVFLLTDDEPGQPGPALPAAPPWRVLIVDDNVDVHKATEIALRDTVYKGRRLAFSNAYSAQQGSAMLRHATDFALVLLDVVMETQDAGLRLARHIREDLGNHQVQIVLRTGQPGEAPERGVIVDYEINDYKSKNELTGTQLFTLVIAALRAYENLMSEHAQHEALTVSLAKIKDLESALDQHAIVAITDPRGRIVHANDRFCAIAKYARNELIGHDHRIINSGVHPDGVFKTMWSTIAEGRIWQGELCNCAKDGSLYWAAVTIVPFFNPDGKCYQYISIGTDITARKHSEQALRETEERWKYALDGAGDGVWDINFDSGVVSFSKRWKEMNGYPDDAPDLRLDGWKGLIHPDDLAQVEADMRAYLTGKAASYANEHRSRCQDGSWKWVLDRGMVVKRGDSGKPIRMVGTHVDITDRKAEHQRLEAASQQFRAMLEAAPGAVCIRRSADLALLFSNAAYGTLFGLDPSGAGAAAGAAGFTDAAEQASLMQAFRDGASLRTAPLGFRDGAGRARRIAVSLSRIEHDGAAATIAWFVDAAPSPA